MTTAANKRRVPPIPRLDGEPESWYHRLITYCLAGPGRSALETYNSERPHKAPKGPAKSLPGSWKKMIDRFQWRERAASFDLATVELEKNAYSELRESERRKRFSLLRRFRRKIHEALVLFNPLNQSLSSIAAAVRALCDMSREETVKHETQSPTAFAAEMKAAFASMDGFIGCGTDEQNAGDNLVPTKEASTPDS